ncbi:MAG: undecaprenyl/decaprenyl-phosphate alpha-N-acetylglucosaminyl 1-phosphate transferase [Sedimentisphaerales bacterium]|nr:undecaprenyl/decaprenyl-phosphate alpha-N-acetylglucosaminyl 1-phosphate transferase [Sedimentisphaerales bacterium]
MKTYLCVYLGSAFLVMVITPAVIWLACRLNAVSIPGTRDVHTKPIPRIGGVVIFVSATSIALAVFFLQNAIGDAFREIQIKVITLLSAAAFVFVVGLIDDIKGLRARMKLLAQLAAATIVCAVGIRIKSVTVADWLMLDFGWFSWPLTILWVVGITNAVNLSDGLDGLAAGIAAIACGVITILAVHEGQVVMAVLMLALLGSLTSFLFFNFNPAKIFMGDCGSLFLGFTIAASSVMCSNKSSALVGLALPVLALGIPIFDTLFSVLRRFLECRSLFSPDRGHFHHRLLDLGLTQRHVVLLIYALTALMAGFGMFMMLTRNARSLAVLSCVLILLLLVFRAVGSVRLRETIAGLQKKHAVAQHRAQERMGFEHAQLYFRNARTFDHWWSAICEAAQRMGLAWVSLKTKDKDGMVRIEVWRTADAPPDMSDVVVMNVPLRNHHTGGQMEFEIAVLVNGSLESAGHQATLFSRLLDEHDIPCLLA